MKITSKKIISWKPCTPYTPERVRELVPHPMTPAEILALPIPAADRLRVVMRNEVLSEKILRQFAADCAQRAIPIGSVVPVFFRATRVGDAAATAWAAVWFAEQRAAGACILDRHITNLLTIIEKNN